MPLAEYVLVTQPTLILIREATKAKIVANTPLQLSYQVHMGTTKQICPPRMRFDNAMSKSI